MQEYLSIANRKHGHIIYLPKTGWPSLVFQHLDQRQMTSWEEMSARLWELIDQMLPFSPTVCHSHPFGLPAVFTAGSNSSSRRILSVKLWLHCLVLASQHSASQIDNDGSPLDTPPKIFYRAHSFIPACIQIEKFRDAQRHTNRITHPPCPLPPSLADTLIYHFIPKRLYTFKQKEETVIVRTQLSCTAHLLDCCGTKSPLLMRLAACE